MRRREFLTATGTASAVVVAGCSESNSSLDDADRESNPQGGAAEQSTPTPRSTPEGIDGLVSESQYLKPVSVEAYAEGYSEGVRGVIRNISDRRLSYVEVSVYFYQGETRVSDSLDNTSELGAGVEWQFDAPYIGDQEWDTFVGVANHR